MQKKDAFLNGDGSNKLLGIFAKTSGGTYLLKFATLKADDMNDLVYKLDRP